MRGSSLIQPKTSLMSGVNSLQQLNQFPAPVRREFGSESRRLFRCHMRMTEARTDEIPCFFPASRENPAGPALLRVTSWATFIAVQQVLGQLGQIGPTRNAQRSSPILFNAPHDGCGS